MTLSRRSYESVRAIHAGLLPPADSVNHISAAKGTPADSVRVETALTLARGLSHFSDGRQGTLIIPSGSAG